jgi:hypothetical protein
VGSIWDLHRTDIQTNPEAQYFVHGVGVVEKGFRSKLVFIDGNLEESGYQRMLTEDGILDDMKDHFGYGEWYFQQEGAPAHRAKPTVKLLQDSIGLIPNWPSNSPDLSVIENIWGIFKGKIAKGSPKPLRTSDRSFIQQEWDGLDQCVIDRLIGSVPRRFQICLDEKGKSIGHLVRKLHLSGQSGGSPVPPGILPIRDLRVTHIGQVVHIAARTRSNYSSSLRESSFWVVLEDRLALTPGPHSRSQIELLVDQEALTHFETGGSVVLFAEVLVAHPRYVDDFFVETPNASPVDVYLAFRSLDTGHD